MKIWLVNLSFLFLAACLPDKGIKESKIHRYYDIEGLIDGQITLLDSVNPSFVKKVVVDGREEIYSGTIYGGGWAGELQILREYDLNKPTLTDKYTSEEKRGTSSTQLRMISKNPLTTRIDTLLLTLDNEQNKLLKIHVYAHSANSLFESGQVADVSFTLTANQVILQSYRIDGWQKLLHRLPNHYSIINEIKKSE